MSYSSEHPCPPPQPPPPLYNTSPCAFPPSVSPTLLGSVNVVTERIPRRQKWKTYPRMCQFHASGCQGTPLFLLPCLRVKQDNFDPDVGDSCPSSLIAQEAAPWKTATNKYTALEEDEQVRRLKMLHDEDEEYATFDTRFVREGYVAKRREDKRKEEESYPRLSRKFKATIKQNTAQAPMQESESAIRQDELLEGELWKLANGERMVSLQDITWVLGQMRQVLPTPSTPPPPLCS